LNQESRQDRPKRARRFRLAYLLVGIGILIAGYLLYRGLSRYTLEDILASVRAVPAGHIAIAAGFAAASYLCLTGFDWLALRYVGHPLPYGQTALASFVSLSLGHNIGFAGVSSGAIRYRFYSRWGLSTAEVAKLVLFCGLTVGLGLTVLGAAALLLRPEIPVAFTGLSPTVIRLIGFGCVAAIAVYLALAAFLRQPLVIRGFSLEMPPLRLALGQVCIGPLNFACVAACLTAAVSAASQAAYLDVATAYVSGNVLALLSHVPGGLGVIEGVVMYLLPGKNLIGPLILFRVVYFFVPLVIGLTVFASAEIAFRRSSGAATESRRPQAR
jgi:hypothetical protein